MGLFAKATEKSAKPSSGSKKNTTWVVGEGDTKTAKAVAELVRLTAEEKAIAAKKSIFSQIVLVHAKNMHVTDFCDLGVPPTTPLQVQTADGEKVTFVVQDRGGQYAVKDGQVDAMVQLLGEDAAAELTFTETSIGFDRTIMAIPGVSEVVEKALTTAINKLVKSEKLTGDQADDLITAKVKQSFKPGTLAKAAQIVGSDKTRLAQFLDAMGSAVCRYVKC